MLVNKSKNAWIKNQKTTRTQIFRHFLRKPELEIDVSR